MNTYKYLFYFAFIAASLSSCATIKPIQSKNLETAINSEENFCNYYNSDSKVRYGFGNNDSVFFLRLEFVDESVANSIAEDGIMVYFDGESKKSKDVYMDFPLSTKQEGDSTSEKSMPSGNQGMPPQMQGGQGMPDMGSFNSSSESVEGGMPPQGDIMGGQMPISGIEGRIQPDAAWVVYDEPYYFNWKWSSYPFKVNISQNESKQVIYEAWIPISEINVSEKGTFMFGVKCPKSKSLSNDFSNMNRNAGGGPGGMSSGGMGGGPGGGMGGPPGGGGPGGGQGGSEAPTGTSSGSSSELFWIAVQL